MAGVMVTLIDREFTVNVSRERAWHYLARLDQWPVWAHHIKHIEVRPQDKLSLHYSGVVGSGLGIKSGPSSPWANAKLLLGNESLLYLERHLCTFQFERGWI